MKLTRSGNQPTFSAWLVLALAIFFILIHIRLSQYAFDDAYIHFRVARNLLDMGAPYFNTNEAIKVSSSSAWTIFLTVLLAIARLLTLEGKFPLIVSIANALISLGGMLIFIKVVEELLPQSMTPARTFFWQAAYLSMMAVASIGLMETPLAMLLSGIGIYSLVKSHPIGFVWLGIAAYFRLELTILVALLGILFTLNGKARFWKIILLTGSGMLPFLLYDHYFFQTIIPHSIVAKSIVYSITGLHTFTRLIFLAFPLGLLNNQLLFFSIGLIVLISVVSSIVVTALRRRDSNQNLWMIVFGAWALLTAIGYISRGVLLFEWYLPLFTIPLFLALTLSTNQGDDHTDNVFLILQSAFTAIYLLGLAQTGYAGVVDPGLYDQFEAGARVKSYLEAGRLLNNVYPNSTLLSSEIGGLGYTFRGHLADAAGLASPEALAFHPMKVPEERARGDLGSIPTKYVEQTMPDLIVSYDHFAQAFLKSTTAEQYNTILVPAYLQQDIPYTRKETIWGDPFLRIYIRKDLPVSDELLSLAGH